MRRGLSRGHGPQRGLPQGGHALVHDHLLEHVGTVLGHDELAHLREANFDPEFFARHEHEIAAALGRGRVAQGAA